MAESARDVIMRALCEYEGGENAKPERDAWQWDYASSAVLSALAEAGLAVAPVEPTEEMLNEAEFLPVDGLPYRLAAKKFYRAMIAAATKP